MTEDNYYETLQYILEHRYYYSFGNIQSKTEGAYLNPETAILKYLLNKYLRFKKDKKTVGEMELI